MSLPCRLIGDERAVTAVEFGLIAPFFLIALLGMFDLGHNMYTAQQLQGAVQKAARDSTIEGAMTTEAAIDARVEAAVKVVSPDATVTFSRSAYSNFSDIGKAEEFTDSTTNPDGVCNDGEPFEDANSNGTWDSDRGRTDSFGTARDALLYTVDVEYQRLFPVAGLIGQSNTFKLRVKTVLRNQPYGLQAAPSVGTCT